MRRSRSSRITFFPLRPNTLARFSERNVLPAPTSIPVIMMTCLSVSYPKANSRLLRTTRKASLIKSRFFSLTTMVESGFSPFFLRFFRGPVCGISPINGTDSFCKSLRPRMVVFMLSRKKITPIGIISPTINPIMRMLASIGSAGAPLGWGGSMSLVL